MTGDCSFMVIVPLELKVTSPIFAPASLLKVVLSVRVLYVTGLRSLPMVAAVNETDLPVMIGSGTLAVRPA